MYEFDIALIGVKAQRAMLDYRLRDQQDVAWVRLRVPYPRILEKQKNGKHAGEDKNNVPSLHAEF